MVDWPERLVTELAERRVVIFLGAGVSASSATAEGEHPKNWSQFLTESLSLVRNDLKREEIRGIVSSRNYLLALQAINDNCHLADYHGLLNRNFNNPQYLPSNLHKLIHELDARIVITTNFDKIYENYCEGTADSNGYKVVCYNSDSLGDEIRSDQRVIVKAHGTINDVQKMIFTRSQYHKAKKDFSEFYEILKAIMLTHTFLFVGCSLDDPDVTLLLEDAKISSSATLPHYTLVKRGEGSEYVLRDWKETYNIEALEFDDFGEPLEQAFANLLEGVEHHRKIYI